MQFCGGIKLNSETLKSIEGIICEANALIVDTDNAITVCGQLWDGDSFKITRAKGRNVITHSPNGEEIIEGAMPISANCGLGLDGRFFTVTNGVVSLKTGYLLKVNMTPADSELTVMDASLHVYEALAGSDNQFIIPSGTSVSVTVQKEGYEGNSQTVVMNANKEVTVEIEPAEG